MPTDGIGHSPWQQPVDPFRVDRFFYRCSLGATQRPPLRTGRRSVGGSRLDRRRRAAGGAAIPGTGEIERFWVFGGRSVGGKAGRWSDRGASRQTAGRGAEARRQSIVLRPQVFKLPLLRPILAGQPLILNGQLPLAGTGSASSRKKQHRNPHRTNAGRDGSGSLVLLPPGTRKATEWEGG